MKKNHSFIALYPKYALNLKLPLVMRISLALLLQSFYNYLQRMAMLNGRMLPFL